MVQYFNLRHALCSPARSHAEQSSSEDSLSSDALESETPPEAPSPKPGQDAVVSSQQDPDKGGHTSGAGYTGAMAPMSIDGGAILDSARSRTRSRRPLRLQHQAGGPP